MKLEAILLGLAVLVVAKPHAARDVLHDDDPPASSSSPPPPPPPPPPSSGSAPPPAGPAPTGEPQGPICECGFTYCAKVLMGMSKTPIL